MKKLKWLFIPSIILIFLTGCFAIPIGDGKKVKLSKSGITFIDEDGKEASLSVDTDEGSIHFSGPDNENLSFGANVDLPDDFPDAIPLAEDAFIYTSSSKGDTVLVLYETGLSFKDILQIYEDFYKNYGFDSVDKQEATLGEGNIRLMFTGYKDGELINTVLTHVKQEKKRQVQIQISEDPFYEPSEDED